MESITWLFTCGAGTLLPTNGLLNLFTLDARSSYPWPLCWGNALWGYVAFACAKFASKKDRPGPGCVRGPHLVRLLHDAANIFTNLLILGKTPGAITSKLVLRRTLSRAPSSSSSRASSASSRA